MLWQRVLTAVILIPLVVAGILYLQTGVLALILAVILLLGAREMGRLANLRSPAGLAAFVIAVGIALWAAWHFLQPVHIASVQGIMTIWWVLTTILLVARRRELQRVDGWRPEILVLGALVLTTAWLSVVRLHAAGPAGPALMLFLFVLIWVADSGAYFAGRAFGKTRLSPFVSPGKTWAGAFGALGGSLICAVGLFIGGWAGSAAWWHLVLLAMLVTAVSIGGDLWESRLKREAGVKDSGNLLPGHGGVLDRIDSLLAAAPVFALGTSLIGAIE